MSGFDDRKAEQEARYVYEENMSFAVEARTSKLFGLWGAEKMGITGDEAEAYAKEVIAANLEEPGFDDIYRKVRGDFDTKGLTDITEAEMREEIHKAYLEAKQQMGEE